MFFDIKMFFEKKKKTFSLLIFALKLFGLMHCWVIFGLININNIINIVAVAFDYSYG